MEKKTKNRLRLFACGALSGALVLVTVNNYSGIKKQSTSFKDEFTEPKFEQIFSDTKEVEQYSFDYYGQKITVQGDSLTIYSSDKNGNMTVEEGEKAKVLVENSDYFSDGYPAEKERTVFKALRNKDKIKDQFSVYVLFYKMEQLYEGYLPFNTVENKKEAIYKACYDYIVSGQDYTIGGYKYSELDSNIQQDILETFEKIAYMRKNGAVEKESPIDDFIKTQGRVIKYELFRIGRK